MTLATNLARWILSVMGWLAMIIFIWSGFGLIISLGNAERVATNKKAIIGAVLGIIIIVGAWTFVNLVLLGFVGDESTTNGAVNVWNG